MTTFDLTTLSPAQISELVEDGGPKKGYIQPAIQNFVDSGNMLVDMSEVISWPKNQDKSVKTVAQQVAALKQAVKTKSLEKGWPELVVIAATLDGNDHESALVVNKPVLDAAKASLEKEAK